MENIELGEEESEENNQKRNKYMLSKLE